MTTPETPIIDGPLDNPDWTTEQNKRFDALDNSGFPMAEARRAALRLASSKSPESTQQTPPESGESNVRVNETADGPPEHVAAELRIPEFTPINETEEDKRAREQAMKDFPPTAA